MKKTFEVTCVICPIGCKAKVILEGERVVSVRNVECPRGEAYAINEVKSPVRDFFTTVKVEGARVPVLPVRTTGPVPKGRIMDCAVELSEVKVKAPMKLGSLIVKNLLNLGVDVISTRDLEAV